MTRLGNAVAVIVLFDVADRSHYTAITPRRDCSLSLYIWSRDNVTAKFYLRAATKPTRKTNVPITNARTVVITRNRPTHKHH